jgi:carboxyl-terminal processing protease
MSAILCLLLAVPLAPVDDPEAILEEAWVAVRDNFYDRNLHGLDWAATLEKYRPEARASGGGRALHDVINRMLAELRASHTVVVEGQVYQDNVRVEFENRRVTSLGLKLVRRPRGLFVQGLLEGGAAEKAGLLRGDRIVTVDGVPVEESERLLPAGTDPGLDLDPLYFLDAGDGKAVRIDVQRTPDSRRWIRVSVTPDRINQIDAVRNSVRVIEVGDLRIGVIHFVHLIHPEVARIFEDALAEEFRDVDGLVVDLRGRGGNARVALRVIRRLEGCHKPMVALIDGHTRSAKEVVSYRIRKRGIGTLVGERTQGAVLGGRFFGLSDGSVLVLACDDVRQLSSGVVLEGVGVAPDVWLEDRMEYAAGEDPIFDRGLSYLTARLEGTPAPTRNWY